VERVIGYYLEGAGAEEMPMTVGFVDGRGFTTLAEQSGPARAMEIVNHHLAVILAVVFAHHGSCLKFLGDGLLLGFGLREKDNARHADQSLKCALAIQEAISAYHSGCSADQRLRFGIGIRTGQVVLGTVGIQNRRDVAIIGDAVNTAQRLMTMARSGEVIRSGQTLAAARDSFAVEFLDATLVKGKSEKVEVYKLIGLKTEGQRLDRGPTPDL